MIKSNFYFIVLLLLHYYLLYHFSLHAVSIPSRVQVPEQMVTMPGGGLVIVALMGADFGGTIAEISDKAASEAVEEGKPVQYESGDGYRRIEASPVEYNEETECHKVRERAWEDNKLIMDEESEICESKKTENVY